MTNPRTVYCNMLISGPKSIQEALRKPDVYVRCMFDGRDGEAVSIDGVKAHVYDSIFYNVTVNLDGPVKFERCIFKSREMAAAN